MRRLIEITVIAAVAVIGSLSAERIGFQDAPRSPGFTPDEFHIAPVRVHLLRLDDKVGVGTKLTKEDIDRVFRKANGIWHAAGIHLWIETVVEEKPAGREASSRLPLNDFNLLEGLRPLESLADGMFHVYYVGRMSVNGLYKSRDALFVQEAANLVVVPGGIDEPLPRVTAHEIGHGFRLRHRQARTNLMASGTTGTTLNEEEIHTARSAAESLRWIVRTESFLESADNLLAAGKKPESAARYRAIIAIPGISRLKDRASNSLGRLTK